MLFNPDLSLNFTLLKGVLVMHIMHNDRSFQKGMVLRKLQSNAILTIFRGILA